MKQDYMDLLEPAQFGAPSVAQDNWNHEAVDDTWWQESTVFTWGDAKTRSAGEARFGMHFNQGVSNLYSWIVLDEQMISKRLVTEQPLPANILDASIAGCRVETIEPLMRYALTVVDGDLTIEGEWENFRHPLTMGYNVGGATIAKGHYNAMGRLKGTGRYRGKTFDVDAVGFNDHSWGVRRSHLPASRSLFCVFDENFCIMAIPVSTGTQRTMVGYVYRDGKLGRLLTESKMGYSFRDDWVTPAGCDALLVDDLGRELHLEGWTFGPCSTQPMGHGKYVTHAGAGFRCDGREGSGILESAQFKGVPPSLRELGLPADSWWLSEDVA
jgi:hypothetical protein